MDVLDNLQLCCLHGLLFRDEGPTILKSTLGQPGLYVPIGFGPRLAQLIRLDIPVCSLFYDALQTSINYRKPLLFLNFLKQPLYIVY